MFHGEVLMRLALLGTSWPDHMLARRLHPGGTPPGQAGQEVCSCMHDLLTVPDG